MVLRLFVVRTIKVRLFFYFGLTFLLKNRCMERSFGCDSNSQKQGRKTELV